MDGRIYHGRRIEEAERFARALEPTIDGERTPDGPPFLFLSFREGWAVRWVLPPVPVGCAAYQ